MEFASDNTAPVCAEIMQAIEQANAGPVPSYGADPVTSRLKTLACEIFETELAIYPVGTGTAANALALATLVKPYGAVCCYEEAHIATDECGAPEFFMGGAKLLTLPSQTGRITPMQVEAAMARAIDGGVHHVVPEALSITQATEWGTVYDVDAVSSLGEAARRRGLAMHMDGARFANALVHLGCTPAELTWKAGVDVLSFGATKNGALAAEAVIFFNPADAASSEGASAPGTCGRRCATSPPSSAPIWKPTFGCETRGTPTARPPGWRRASPPSLGCASCRPCRRTRFSPPCRTS
jgi:threonine aldolase